MGMLRIPQGCIQPIMSSLGNKSFMTAPIFLGSTVYNINYNPNANGLIHSLLNGTMKGFSLYKGAVPTQADMDAFDSTTQTTSTKVDPRASDLLITFNPSSISMSGRNLVINLSNANASATGSATWFRLIGGWQVGANYYFPVLCGSISGVGGGGDIETGSVAYNSGTNYKLPQISLALPVKYFF